MALPKLNTIEYFCKLPVSGREAKYRPFTVGEQKVLLQALEDGEVKTISNTVVNLVDSCCTLTESKDTVRDLSNTDLEYLFLQVRIKSVGEVTNVVLGCENQPTCDGQSTVEVDLTSIDIEGEIKDNKIMLTDSVGVTLKVPNFNEIQATIGDITEIGSSDIFSVLAQSIESIFDAEEVHNKGDFTTKELNDFVNELSTEQFNNIMEWFSSLPKLIKDVEYNCSKCGTPCKVRLEGIQNFFV
tara:strand:+ start:9119 stop:9844 length:726 start_codon:yes stop_codon:yes gene_type:complete